MTTVKTSDTSAGRAVYCLADNEDLEFFGPGTVIAAELESIRRQRKLPEDTELKTQDLCGLALSGGGIRSASFSLGVMQALAHSGWLARIDYLSTVSGGGYIGSSLTWALHSDPATFGLLDQTFPFASFPMSSEARDVEKRTPLVSRLGTEKIRWRGRLLNFLRQNATYLTPGKGFNLFALVWIALRGAGLGLLVYGALITLFFLLAFQFHLFQEVCAFPLLPKALKQNWFLLAAVLGFALCILTVPLYSIATYLYHWAVKGAAYPLRRRYESTAGWLLPVLLGLLLFGLVPLAHDWVVAKGTNMHAKTGQFTLSGNLSAEGALSVQGTMEPTAVTEQPGRTRSVPCASPCPEPPQHDKNSLWAILFGEIEGLLAGLGTILVGLFSGVMAFFKTKSLKPGRVPLGLIVSLGVAALLSGIILFAYTVAFSVVESTKCNTSTMWFFVVGLAVTLILAILTNLNHISIHRYYRDRLMETFMPDIDHVLNGEYLRATESGRANLEPLHSIQNIPYHIINTNLVLAYSDNPKFRVRGGDNFILSPQYCGSYATGWQWTEDFLKGTMTLASAMAISGAALNPSAGCGGDGITRSPALSVLMGLLNFRLGYWVPNPKHSRGWFGGLRNPNFLLPGLWEVLLRHRLNENGVFLQLSDGGHFENLALYELVRRKLKLIIVCDGGADPQFTFSDLANAMEKVRTDFGALIMIDNDDLKALIPMADNGDKDGLRRARRGYLAATIKYADNSEGTLIYLTTTFFKGLSADLYGYKKEHPAFPDESTGDQFFDEKQFEAYRELGFQAAWRMMDDDGVVDRAWPEGPPERGQLGRVDL